MNNLNDLGKHVNNSKMQSKIDILEKEVAVLKKEKEKKLNSKSKMTIAVQILIAFYSGMLDDFEKNNKDKARIIQEKFGAVGIENIRKKLSNIRDLMTKKNLTITFQYFENLNRKDLVKLVLKDLKRFKKVQ